MDRLLLLLLFIAWAAAAAAAEDVCEDDECDDEWSVICAFGRLELDELEDDVYDECREGEEVADAGDEGRNTAKNSKELLRKGKIKEMEMEIQYSLIPWFELTEMPRVGLAWYDDEEEVDERVPGADEGDLRL